MNGEDADRIRAQLALDGELGPAEQLAFARDLAASPELAAEHARLQALRATLRRHAAPEPAPERLRARVEALAAPPAPAAPRPRWLGPALAAGFALVAATAGYEAGRSGADPETSQLVAGYQRAALAGQPFDIASSDRHTVKPWLAARAAVGVFAPDLASAGFPLAGGRLDVVDSRPVPTLVYRREAHTIAVSELPASASSGESESRDGYHVVCWRDAERAYVAVSDLDAPELARFVSAFQAAAK